ncbi:MAG: HNH endonuclease signature motif containing protein [Acidobacteriota bacterium]
MTAKQHGGTDEPANLAWACPSCNRFKGPNLTAIDPKSGAIAPLFHPRTQAWQEHFALRGLRIVGLTAVGRATVRLLQMNSEERMEIRQRLQSLGDWPPGENSQIA